MRMLTLARPRATLGIPVPPWVPHQNLQSEEFRTRVLQTEKVQAPRRLAFCWCSINGVTCIPLPPSALLSRGL